MFAPSPAALGGEENNHDACVVNQYKLVSAAGHHVVTHPHFHTRTRPTRSSAKNPHAPQHTAYVFMDIFWCFCT